jgi:proteasome assembly chaperone (PAC2) family protein
MAAVPDICKGKPAGTVIGSSGLLHNKIEIAGYAVEIICLLKKLEGLQDCDACKKITTIRIKQVRKERDKNK